jgi:hypothetical protein
MLILRWDLPPFALYRRCRVNVIAGRRIQHGRRQDDPWAQGEVAYWTKKFGVSRDEPATAVKEVGHSAVEKHLRDFAETNDASVNAT